MELIDFSVDRPVTVWVGVILVMLFGIVAMVRLPVQMRPTVDKPEIQIETIYPGAAPPEVEQQVTDKLEEELASVEDMTRITGQKPVINRARRPTTRPVRTRTSGWHRI